MPVNLFIQGIVFGFLIAVPVGPMALLCVNRMLSGGFAYGLSSTLGVAAADALAAGVAALGVTLVANFLVSQQMWLRPVGALFLCYLGCRLFTTRPDRGAARSDVLREISLWSAFVSTFLLNFSNPVTILSFLAMYAGFGVRDLSGQHLSAALLISGVFVGSALWGVLFATGLLLFHVKFGERELRWVHITSGIIIAGFGLVMLVNPF